VEGRILDDFEAESREIGKPSWHNVIRNTMEIRVPGVVECETENGLPFAGVAIPQGPFALCHFAGPAIRGTLPFAGCQDFARCSRPIYISRD